jgi:hypothetical protein
MEPVSNPRILYVCSAARCGSTVLDMFLGGHPKATSLGELNLIGKALKLGQMCTCGAVLAGCPAWNRVFDDIRANTGIHIPADPYAYRLWNARARVVVDREHQNLAFEAAFKVRKAWLLGRSRLPAALRYRVPLPSSLEQSLSNKMALYASIARAWGRDVIVDSSKNPWEAVELVRRWPDQVKVVLLTRDGRGVYLSRRGSGSSRHESVDGWRTYYRRVQPLLRREVDATNLVELRYEDFATRPGDVGRQLCGVVGLDYNANMVELGAGERHMVNGNETRFKPQKGIRLDERWRQELAGDEMAYFEQHGGALNAQLGYR